MRRSNSKETRRAVEAYIFEEIGDILDHCEEPETARPVSKAFEIIREEMDYQSYIGPASDRPVYGAGLAAKYAAAGRYDHYAASTPYRVMWLYAAIGNLEAYTGPIYQRLREWLDETPEESNRYTDTEAERLFYHLTASAFERLYQRELEGMPATIAPALTGAEEFHIVFQQSRMVLFSVGYYTLGNNRAPYFATQACKYNQNKSDIVEGGQAQDRLTTGKIRAFWKKWDPHHLQQLTDEERRELARDLESLKQVYNHIQFTADKAPHYPTTRERRALSMQKIRRNAVKEA